MATPERKEPEQATSKQDINAEDQPEPTFEDQQAYELFAHMLNLDTRDIRQRYLASNVLSILMEIPSFNLSEEQQERFGQRFFEFVTLVSQIINDEQEEEVQESETHLVNDDQAALEEPELPTLEQLLLYERMERILSQAEPREGNLASTSRVSISPLTQSVSESPTPPQALVSATSETIGRRVDTEIGKRRIIEEGGLDWESIPDSDF